MIHPPLTTTRRCAILCVGGDNVILLYALLLPILILVSIARDS